MRKKYIKGTFQKQKHSETLKLFEEEKSDITVSSLLDSLVRILALPDEDLVSKGGSDLLYFLKQLESLTKSDPSILSQKTSKVFSQVTREKTLLSHLKQLPTLGMTVNGNLLILSGFSPKIESGYSLSDILEKNPDRKYFLSRKTLEKAMKEKLFGNPRIISQEP